MDLLIQGIRYAIRQLFRQRGVSIVAILTLALGIGASTAAFTVIDAAMLRPLPYPDPEQLVTLGVEVILPDGQVSRPVHSMEDMRFWQQADDVFSFVAGWGTFGGPVTLIAAGSLTAWIPSLRAARVDPVATLRTD